MIFIMVSGSELMTTDGGLLWAASHGYVRTVAYPKKIHGWGIMPECIGLIANQIPGHWLASTLPSSFTINTSIVWTRKALPNWFQQFKSADSSYDIQLCGRLRRTFFLLMFRPSSYPEYRRTQWFLWAISSDHSRLLTLGVAETGGGTRSQPTWAWLGKVNCIELFQHIG